MELRRNIYKKLLAWKKENTGRVLELQGARQVGKTYILKKFGKENFSKMVYINMAETTGKHFLQCVSIAMEWEPGKPMEETPIRKALELYDETFKDNKDTVVIIDEIQESAEIYNQIRTLAREFQAYVIVTGSYLGRTIEPDFFLPAGDMDHMVMESMTFDEFLDVFDERELYEKIDLYGKGRTEDYKKLMEYYEIYQKIIDGNYKIHCLEQLTKESSHSPEKEKTIEFPHIQQDEPVVIEEVAPERVVTEEEKQPVHKIWGIEVGIGICAVLTVYAAAVLLFPEMAVIDMSVYFCVFLILAGCAGGVFLQKKRKKLKEMGELTQLTQEKKYSFVPEEEEEPKNNEKGQKPYEPPKEAAGSNTILLSDYLQKKKDLNLTLVLQNGQELESYYEERLLPDTFPCAIGYMAAYCSIVIHSELISRLHACIYREDGAFYLEDMNSTNGTFLNGRRLLPKERQLLSDGDMVGFANLLYKVEKS